MNESIEPTQLNIFTLLISFILLYNCKNELYYITLTLIKTNIQYIILFYRYLTNYHAIQPINQLFLQSIQSKSVLHQHIHQYNATDPSIQLQLHNIPTDILFNLVYYLQPGEVARLQCISSYYYTLYNQSDIWLYYCNIGLGRKLHYHSVCGLLLLDTVYNKNKDTTKHTSNVNHDIISAIQLHNNRNPCTTHTSSLQDTNQCLIYLQHQYNAAQYETKHRTVHNKSLHYMLPCKQYYIERIANQLVSINQLTALQLNLRLYVRQYSYNQNMKFWLTWLLCYTLIHDNYYSISTGCILSFIIPPTIQLVFESYSTLKLFKCCIVLLSAYNKFIFTSLTWTEYLLVEIIPHLLYGCWKHLLSITPDTTQSTQWIVHNQYHVDKQNNQYNTLQHYIIQAKSILPLFTQLFGTLLPTMIIIYLAHDSLILVVHIYIHLTHQFMNIMFYQIISQCTVYLCCIHIFKYVVHWIMYLWLVPHTLMASDTELQSELYQQIHTTTHDNKLYGYTCLLVNILCIIIGLLESYHYINSNNCITLVVKCSTLLYAL